MLIRKDTNAHGPNMTKYRCDRCDGNRITITKEEQRIIDDYISPIKHIDWEKASVE